MHPKGKLMMMARSLRNGGPCDGMDDWQGGGHGCLGWHTLGHAHMSGIPAHNIKHTLPKSRSRRCIHCEADVDGDGDSEAEGSEEVAGEGGGLTDSDAAGWGNMATTEDMHETHWLTNSSGGSTPIASHPYNLPATWLRGWKATAYTSSGRALPRHTRSH